MNLHLTHDNIFIDYIITAGEELCAGTNKFLIIQDEGVAISRIRSKNIYSAAYNSEKFWNIVGNLNQYKAVYIHWLYGDTARFVNSLPPSVKVVWCFWGGEGLELPGMLKDVYQPKSYQYFIDTKPGKIKFEVKDLRGYWKKKKSVDHLYKENLKAIRRVNYFAHYLERDYRTIQKHTHFKAAFVPFFYAPLQEIVPYELTVEDKGTDILLGNSDTLTNNHFEAIDLLKDTDLTGRKIYCPLSYENGKYAADVASYGQSKLGDAFIPLRNYMPKEEYNKILSDCAFGVMNHNRSQALGNILVLLWGGAKVFMSEQSSLYRFLSGNGVLVFPFEESVKTKSRNFFVKLSTEEIKFNRSKLEVVFGKQKHREQMQKLFLLE